ncbi:MAG: hypothetical protein JXB33_08510 [Clostridia bacterium]|nr:hypothetical protein [Clostridia bacterium]
MINKTGKFLRKIHRYLTPVFIAITVWYMLINKNPGLEPVLFKVQRLLMLTLAVTGAFLFFQIYYNKGKSRKRRIAEKQ